MSRKTVYQQTIVHGASSFSGAILYLHASIGRVSILTGLRAFGDLFFARNFHNGLVYTHILGYLACSNGLPTPIY